MQLAYQNSASVIPDEGEEGQIEVVLSFGSNCGDRVVAVAAAMEWISTVLTGFSASDIYETLPVGHSGGNYMNAVASGTFHGKLSELERLCKDYELAHGRDAESRLRKLVPIDIDIVIASGVVIRPRDYTCTFFRQGFNQLTSSIRLAPLTE